MPRAEPVGVGKTFTVKRLRAEMPKSGTAWKLYKYELPIEDLLAEWIASGLVVREGEGVYRATQRGLDLAPAAAGLSDR